MLARENENTTLLEDSVKEQIIANLMKVNVSQEKATDFVDFIEKCPYSDSLKKLCRVLTVEKNPNSKREQYYQISNYIAEFKCTLSNAGFFGVGFYFGDYSTLTAGFLSALSHTIPFQSLQVLDFVGIAVVFAKAASQYKTVIAKPFTLAWAGGAIAVNVMDTILSKVAKKYYPDNTFLNGTATSLLHLVWHLSAAYALYEFNEAHAEVAKTKFDDAAKRTDIIFSALLAAFYGVPLAYSAGEKILNSCKNTFFSQAKPESSLQSTTNTQAATYSTPSIV